ncbi:MAG: hypothetical protein ABI134_18460, partial [Byssovorax sp.]
MIKSRLFPRSLPVLVGLLTSALLLGCGSDTTSSSTTGSSTTGSSSSSSGSGGGGGEPALSTIAEARALAEGERATVEGFVTVAPGTFNSATLEQSFAIQDDKAGVYVTLPDLLDLTLDQRVRVTGKLAQV